MNTYTTVVLWDTTAMAPSVDDTHRQLDRLLASGIFANAGRMSRFLKFVVEKTLAGEAERLKEYVIGVEVFDRDEDYDPRVDAIVRVEAARLRAKLAEYYTGEGRADPVVLSLPKGAYAAVIKLQSAPPAVLTEPTLASPAGGVAVPASAHRMPARSWAIGVTLASIAAVAVVAWAPWSEPSEPDLRIAVLPFEPYSDDAAERVLATQITEGVTAELVRSGPFAVVASSAARAAYTPAARPRDVAETLDADVLIQARVTTDGDRVRVEARAMSGGGERKLWVDTFAGTVADSDALERDIATAIPAALSPMTSDLRRVD